MAKLPTSDEALTSQFGPHLNYPPREGFPGRNEPDKIVETHCCFCGMQCGIKLVVKDNKVVGFEPWEEFPYNEGASARKAFSVTCKTTTRTGCFSRWSGSTVPASSARVGSTLSRERCLKSSAFRANMDPMPSECYRVSP